MIIDKKNKEKKKEKKEDENDDNKVKIIKNSNKKNGNFMGRSYSAPKAIWVLLLVRQLQIILGEKLFGPKPD